MMPRHLWATLTALACLIAAPEAMAQPKAPQGFSAQGASAHFAPAQAASFAKRVEKDLAARNARLAIVFRTGRPRDRLPEGIDYTHGAFWVYGEMPLKDGQTYQGYAVYNLYRGDGVTLPVNRSEVKQDFPFDFVMASAEDDLAVIIPSPEMQRRLIALIASGDYERMHVPSYSLVSNPANAKHQNCTEFLLDVIAAAAWETKDYTQIKLNLAQHFKATEIKASPIQRFFGPMVEPSLTLDDQKGPILTATEASIAGFMKGNHLMSEAYVLTSTSEIYAPRPSRPKLRQGRVWIPLDPQEARPYGQGQPAD